MFKRLHYKMIGYLFLAALIFISLAGLISFRIELNRAERNAEVMIDQLIASVSADAYVGIYMSNHVIIEDVLKGLLKNDVIYKASIRTDKNLFLEKTKGDLIDNRQEIIRPIFSPYSDNRVRNVGELRITVDKAFILKNARYNALSSALNAFILVSLTLLVMLIMIRSVFSQPLIHITNALNAIISGEKTRLDITGQAENDEVGHLMHSINKTLDELNTKISTQKNLRKQIEAEEKKLRNIFHATSAGLFLLNEDGHIVTVAPILLKILGETEINDDFLQGQCFGELFFKDPAKFEKMLIAADMRGQLETHDLQLIHEDVWVHCLLSKTLISDIVHFEGVIFDISQRIAAEQAMHYQATHDPLTKLLRRHAAESRLENYLASENPANTLILLLDLDGFKKANDTFGHDAGDSVLIETAQRLTACVRHNDLVCRLGGDEFLIILFDCSPVSIGLHIAQHILNAIRRPVIIDAQRTAHIGVSIGISCYPLHGTSVETLLKTADEAMYEVKRNGKNGYAMRQENGKLVVMREKPAL